MCWHRPFHPYSYRREAKWMWLRELVLVPFGGTQIPIYSNIYCSFSLRRRRHHQPAFQQITGAWHSVLTFCHQHHILDGWMYWKPNNVLRVRFVFQFLIKQMDAAVEQKFPSIFSDLDEAVPYIHLLSLHSANYWWTNTMFFLVISCV